MGELPSGCRERLQQELRPQRSSSRAAGYRAALPEGPPAACRACGGLPAPPGRAPGKVRVAALGGRDRGAPSPGSSPGGRSSGAAGLNVPVVRQLLPPRQRARPPGWFCIKGCQERWPPPAGQGEGPGPPGRGLQRRGVQGPTGRCSGRQGRGLQRGGVRARQGEACREEVCGPIRERSAERRCAGPSGRGLQRGGVRARWGEACMEVCGAMKSAPWLAVDGGLPAGRISTRALPLGRRKSLSSGVSTFRSGTNIERSLWRTALVYWRLTFSLRAPAQLYSAFSGLVD